MNEKEKIDLAQTVKNLVESMPAQLQMADAMAKITRAKYLALVREGFSCEQALVLCRRHG